MGDGDGGIQTKPEISPEGTSLIPEEGYQASRDYPGLLRRIRYVDLETNKHFVCLTNNVDPPALTFPRLYKCRWQVELFFKWIKQNIRIKAFCGTIENAVKTQIWIAICVYVLVAILKKELNIKRILEDILKILSVAPFKRVPLVQLLSNCDVPNHPVDPSKQSSLFNS